MIFEGFKGSAILFISNHFRNKFPSIDHYDSIFFIDKKDPIALIEFNEHLG